MAKLYICDHCKKQVNVAYMKQRLYNTVWGTYIVAAIVFFLGFPFLVGTWNYWVLEIVVIVICIPITWGLILLADGIIGYI